MLLDFLFNFNFLFFMLFSSKDPFHRHPYLFFHIFEYLGSKMHISENFEIFLQKIQSLFVTKGCFKVEDSGNCVICDKNKVSKG